MRRIFLIALVAAVGIALGMSLAANRKPLPVPPGATLAGTVRPVPQALDGFTLTDHAGAHFGSAQLRDRWTLIFFGYTYCPDICPTTMLTLRDAVATLASSGATPPQVVLVSVDPVRDDAATLGQYVRHFDDAFVGVRGDDAQLAAFVKMAGSMFEREPAREDGSYEVAHSASIFVVDPLGRMYAVISPPLSAATVAERFTAIQRHYALANREQA